MRLTDFTKLFKTHQGIITEVNHCFSDYYTVKVTMDKRVTWVAGEHAIFSLQDKRINGRRWRVFSIASIPEDGYVLLGFRTGEKPSPYKQFIIDHGLHATIQMRGSIGDFTLRKDKRPVVLFAAGVGITPIFSILQSIRSNQKREVYVIYASAQYHLFKDEIDSIAQENPQIHLVYVHQSEQAQAKLTELTKKFGNAAYYYIAGAGQVIKSTKNLLKSLGIKKGNLLNDYFVGYQ